MLSQLEKVDRKLIVVIILAIAWGVFLVPEHLQLRSEEPRRAIVAMEMIFTGDYLRPQLNGWPYYNKPPLFTWVLAGTMQLMNSFDEWVVRLPGLLSFAVTGCLIYFFVRRFLPQQTAILSALFFLTGGEILFYGLVIAGQIDLFFTLLVFLQISTLYLGLTSHKNSTLFLLFSALFLALGIMTKGLPSIAFHGLTLLGWSAVQRTTKHLLRWEHVVGGLIVVLLVGGYFLLYNIGGEGWAYLVNLYKEAAQKSGFEGSGWSVISNAIEFPGAFLKTLLPWSLLALFVISKEVRKAIWKNSLVKFCLVFMAFNLPIYWLASAFSLRYIYPVLPFLAIPLAVVANQVRYQKQTQYFYYFLIALLFLSPILFLAGKLFFFDDVVPHYWVKFMVVLLSGIVLGLAWFRRPKHRLFFGILIVALLKIYADWMYYPIRAEADRNDALLGEALQYLPLIEHQQVALFGEAVMVVKDASLGPITLGEVTYAEPMQVSFQHIYYIERHLGKVMPFHTEMQPNFIYLARQEDVAHLSISILYSFVDDFLRTPLVLCKMNSPI